MTANDDAYAPDEETTETPSPPAPMGELQPFTPERFLCANSMGMLWPGVVAQGPRNTILYPGQAADAVILLWVCTLPVQAEDSKQWSVRRAQREPDAANTEARRWAEELGIITPGSPQFWAGINRFTDIVLETRRAYTVAKDDSGDEPPN